VSSDRAVFGRNFDRVAAGVAVIAFLGAVALILGSGAAASQAADYVPGTPVSICMGSGSAAGECGELRGIAVDQSNGHVYVVDQGNLRVDEFDASGAFVKAFGAGVSDGVSTSPQVCTVTCFKGVLAAATGGFGNPAKGIAVDPKTHVVYIATASARLAFYDGTTGAYLGLTEGDSGAINVGAPEHFNQTTGVAVDTSDPLQHYLYVSFWKELGVTKIDKFKISAAGLTDGSYVCQITGTATATSVNATECGGNGLASHKDGAFEGLDIGQGAASQQGGSLAVDAEGNVFVLEAVGSSGGESSYFRHVVSQFDKNGDFVTQFRPVVTGSPSEPRPEAVAVIGDGNLLVADDGVSAGSGGATVQEFNPASISPATPPAITLASSLAEFGSGTIGGSLGIAVSGSDVYVADKANKKIWKYSAVSVVTHTLTINKSGAGTGQVECKFDGGALEACTSPQPTGTLVEVIASPDGGSELTGLSGTGSGGGCSTSPCSFTLEADSSVTAVFELEVGQRGLTTSATGTGSGQIKCEGGTCAANYQDGATVTLEALPGSDSQFGGWTITGAQSTTCTGTTSPCTITFGSSDVTAAAQFDRSSPLVTGIAPGEGPEAGGNSVTITGTNLASATSVKFGASAATIVENTATQIKVTAPSCVAGTVDVTVTTVGGTSANTAADDYTCVVAPTVTGLSPNKGPLAAGNSVTITGFNLANAAQVKFGASTATIVENTATQIKVTAPAGAAGTVNVSVITAGGTSANNPSDDYTYQVEAYSLIINNVGSGGGSVTCDGGSCAPSYTAGTQVTLVGSPSSVSTFNGFSGGGCSGTGPCVVTINATTVVTATFNAKPVAEPPPKTCGTDPTLCPPLLPPSNVVKLGTAKPQGTSIALKLTVPGAGSLVATGKNLVKATASPKGAGVATLMLKPSKTGKKLLQETGKLKVEVKIVYTPAGGFPGTAKVTITFKSKAKK
jgi:hypothetical protein